MTKDLKNSSDLGFIEFVPAGEFVSSDAFVGRQAFGKDETAETDTLSPTARLEDMPPVFRELADPKLPELSKEDRARLQMQSPNRLFFYWSVGSNPFQKLNKALGSQTASYSLVLKLVDLKRDLEEIVPVDSSGSRWFEVEADSEYRAEIGFYAPNRPYVRALFSNTVKTPRKTPSPRVDSEADWAIRAARFARVLEVAGFSQDAFDVALAGDDTRSSDAATHAAFSDLVDEPNFEAVGIEADEMRCAMLLLASGLSLEALRWKISPSLFAILQKRAGSLSGQCFERTIRYRSRRVYRRGSRTRRVWRKRDQFSETPENPANAAKAATGKFLVQKPAFRRRVVIAGRLTVRRTLCRPVTSVSFFMLTCRLSGIPNTPNFWKRIGCTKP